MEEGGGGGGDNRSILKIFLDFFFCMQRFSFSIHDRVRQLLAQRDVTHFFSHIYTDMQAQYTTSTSKEGMEAEKKIKNRGDMKRSGQLVVCCLKLGANHPQAQAWSNTVASQPPDGPCPLAIYCCCDICHNNQVTFV